MKYKNDSVINVFNNVLLLNDRVIHLNKLE